MVLESHAEVEARFVQLNDLDGTLYYIGKSLTDDDKKKCNRVNYV